MQTLTGYICVATCFHRVHQLLKFFKLSTFISKQKREEHGWVLLNQQFSLSLVLFIFSQEYAEDFILQIETNGRKNPHYGNSWL